MDEQSSGPANHGDWLGVWFSLSDTPGFRSNHLRYSLSIWLWCNPFPPKARFLICTRWCPITGAVRGHIGLNACLAPRRQHRASDRGGRVIPDVSPMTIPARSSLWDLCLLHLSLSPRKEGKLKKKKKCQACLKRVCDLIGAAVACALEKAADVTTATPGRAPRRKAHNWETRAVNYEREEAFK